MNKNPYFKIIILTIIFGLGAGIVGYLFSAAYILPTTTFINGTGEKIKQPITLSEENKKIAAAQEEVAPTIVEIYHEKEPSVEHLSQIYLPGDRIALGSILTSDGWLVSFGHALSDPKSRFVIKTADQKLFSPEKIIFDDATGVAFIKIIAENLPIPKLGSYKNLALGEKTIVPLSKQSLVSTQIKNLIYEKNIEPADLVHSSEKFSKLVLVSAIFETNEIGAPLVNMEGEIVGILSDLSGTTIPIAYWQPAFLTTLKNDKVIRPYLGINYLNLAGALGLSESISQGQTSGSLVWSDQDLKIQGVLKNSPAAKAGLRDGDIILKINDEEVTAKTDLVEIIQEYSPGDTIEVTILRSGEEKTLEVNLEENL